MEDLVGLQAVQVRRWCRGVDEEIDRGRGRARTGVRRSGDGGRRAVGLDEMATLGMGLKAEAVDDLARTVGAEGEPIHGRYVNTDAGLITSARSSPRPAVAGRARASRLRGSG